MEKRRKYGFTLIELLVTVAILSLIGVVALVIVNNLTNKAEETKIIANEKSVLAAGKEFSNEFDDNLTWISNTEETMACVPVERLIEQGFLSEKTVGSEEDKDYKNWSIKVIKSNVGVNDYVLLKTSDCKIKDTLKPIINFENLKVEIKTDYNVITGVTFDGTGTNIVNEKTKITLEGKDITSTKDLPLGNHNIVYAVEDEAGNKAEATRVITIEDTGVPTTTLKQNPDSNTNKWMNNKITLTGTATDNGSGIVAYKFTQNENASSGEWTNLEENTTTLTKTQDVSTNGKWYFHVKDAANNTATGVVELFIDDKSPEFVSKNGSASYNSVPTATFKDNESGIKDVKYYISTVSTKPENNNTAFTTNKSVSMSCYNTYYMWSIATDKAGNISSVTSLGNYYYDCYEEEDDWYYEEEDTCDWLCQMEQNSEAWWEAETDEERKALEEANKELAEANGLSKDENFDDGQWKDNNGDNLYEVSGGNKK